MKDMHEINCGCGKLLAKFDGEKLILYCKRCKKEIPVQIVTPKAPGPRKPNNPQSL